MMREQKPDREDAPPPCSFPAGPVRLPAGGKKPPCWPLPDLIPMPLIKCVLSPMNREIFGPESIFLPASRERPRKQRGARRRPFGDPAAAAQVSRLEKRTVVARAR